MTGPVVYFAQTRVIQAILFQCSPSPRRWHVIEIALGDCTVLSDSCIMMVTFKIPAPETSDHTIHWPNADVMLSHRLRCWANIISTKTL